LYLLGVFFTWWGLRLVGSALLFSWFLMFDRICFWEKVLLFVCLLFFWWLGKKRKIRGAGFDIGGVGFCWCFVCCGLKNRFFFFAFWVVWTLFAIVLCGVLLVR